MVAVASVQRGQVSLAVAASSTTVSISSVDTTRSLIQWSVQGDGAIYTGDTQPDSRVRLSFDDATTLAIERFNTTEAIEVHWQVVEFDSSVSVQHGTISPEADGSTDATITAVDTSSTVVVGSGAYNDNPSEIAPKTLGWELIDATTIRCDYFDDPGYPGASVFGYQVVEFDPADVTIQSIAQNGTAGGIVPRDYAISTVDTTASIVVSTGFHGGARGRDIVDYLLSSSTTVTADTVNSELKGSDSGSPEFQVIEFASGVSVERARYETANTVETIAHSVDNTLSFVHSTLSSSDSGFASRGGYKRTTADIASQDWSLDLQASNLVMTRSDTEAGRESSIAYEIVEFPAATGGPETAALDGLAGASGLGELTVSPLPASVTLDALASTSGLGDLVVAALPVTVVLGGLAAASAFGELAVEPVSAAVALDGVAGTSGIGELGVSPVAPTVVLDGAAGGSGFGELSVDPLPGSLTLDGCVGTSGLGELAFPGTWSPELNRTSGVAPLAVDFDAWDFPAVSSDRGWERAHFAWDFGDPGAGTWPTNGRDKNLDEGPIAAHVYETPGDYTWTLTVTDEDDTVSTYSGTINVTDPDVVFAGTDTICVSAAGDFTGAPTGALEVTSSDFDATLVAYLASGKRILFRRGETFTLDTEVDLEADILEAHVGAFGSGAKPRIDHSSRILMGAQSSPLTMDVRFVDLDWNGTSSAVSTFSHYGEINDALFLRNDHDGSPGHGTVYDFLYDIPRLPDWQANGHGYSRVFIVEATTGTTSGGSGKVTVFISPEGGCLMGCDLPDSTGIEHILRAQSSWDWVCAHNKFGIPASDKAQATFRGASYALVGADPDRKRAGDDLSGRTVIRCNEFIEVPGGANPTGINPTNDSVYQKFNGYLVEANLFRVGPDTIFQFRIEAEGTAVRNNLWIVNATNDKAANAVRLTDAGSAELPNDAHLTHNTSVHLAAGEDSSHFNQAGATASNTFLYNNYMPEGGVDPSIWTDVAGNVIEVDDFVSGSPSDPATDFFLAETSAGYGGADATGTDWYPVRTDYWGNPRPRLGADVGAFQTVSGDTVSLGALRSTSGLGELVPEALPSSLTLDGLSGGSGFGELTVDAAVSAVALGALQSTSGLGEIGVTPVPVNVALGALAGLSGLGELDVQGPGVSVSLDGLASTSGLGELAVEAVAVSVLLGGLQSNAGLGELTVAALPGELTLDGLVSVAKLGDVVVAGPTGDPVSFGATATDGRASATATDVRASARIIALEGAHTR